MRQLKIGDKYITTTGILFLLFTLLTFFIPTRGSILGISSGKMLVYCCVIGAIVFHKKPKTIPIFYWIYVIDILICIMHHYSDRVLYVHLIEIMQVIGLVYLTTIAVRSKKDFNQVIDCVLLLFSVYAALGIIESVLKINIFDLLTGTQVVYEYANGLRFGLARSRGACGTSIHNGMLLVLVLCLAAYKIFNTSRKNWKYNLAYILILINCFCTFSRAIWLEVCISQILILLVQRPDKQFKIVAKIFLGVFAVIIVCLIVQPSLVLNLNNIVSEMFGSVIDTLMGNSNSSVGVEGDRLLLWGWVWQTVVNSAVWGCGYAVKFAYLTKAGYVKESIEVMWLYKLFREGFVGLIGYIFLQVSCLLYFVLKWRKSNNRKRQAGLNFNCVMLILCVAYFITQFSCAGSEDLRLFYFILGLAFAFNKIEREEEYICE